VTLIFIIPLQAEIIHNHENENVRNMGQGKTPQRKYIRGLNLAAVTSTTVKLS
jgi:hypothetical protein